MPYDPDFWSFSQSSANSRHSVRTGHAAQMLLAKRRRFIEGRCVPDRSGNISRSMKTGS